MSLDKLQTLLCPPGNGVYTVNTAKEKKQQLHQRMYDTYQEDEVLQKYQQTLTSFIEQDNKASAIALLGLCSDCGGGIQRGANWGPLFIREKLQAGRFAENYLDLGDVRTIPHLLHDKYLNEQTITSCRDALYQNKTSQLPVSPLSIAELALTELYQYKPNTKVLALGGDHSVSYPLVKTYLASRHQHNRRCALIHFDAHTDLLVSRLGIDLCFGSWLTHVLEGFENPSHVAQFGIRSSGKPKTHWQSTFGIQQFWAHEIQQQGIESFCHAVIEYFQQENIDELYISFDIDALDASIASATGTPEPGGLSLEQALIAISLFSAAFPVTGADVVEVAPMVNPAFSKAEPENTLLAAQRISEALLYAMG